jgi:curved DNA-binding protein CbpA
MHRRSVLRAVPCDLKKLPIGALEAFVLSQVRGSAFLEEVAEVSGLEVDQMLRIAEFLRELGALEVDGEKAKTRRPPGASRGRRTSAPPKSRRADHATARPSRSSRAHSPARKSVIPPATVPVARRVDPRSLGISARQGFVLSQIDGATSVADLQEITHLPVHELDEVLRALESAGAVELPGRKGQKKTTRAPPPRQSKAEERPKAETNPDKAQPKTEPKTEEECDLDSSERAQIEELVGHLGVDHYTLLGAPRDADGKAIKRAYYALASRFHPDRFFGRKLGAFRQKLDRVFVRLTLAHDTLTNRAKRAEYDATLPPIQPAHVRRKTKKSMRAIRPPVVPAAAPPPAPAPMPMPPPGSVPIHAPAPDPRASDVRRPDPLLRLYADQQRQAIRRRADVFLRAAQEALDRDELSAAANHYRLAVQVTDDADIRAALEDTDKRARARVRQSSLADATVAEKAARWAEAADKYGKAYSVQAEPWVAERAANALRLAGGDLRRAVQLADQAVLAEPQNPAYHVTLGEVCLAAGLQARAAGEAERALALGPTEPNRQKAQALLVATGAAGRKRRS